MVNPIRIREEEGTKERRLNELVSAPIVRPVNHCQVRAEERQRQGGRDLQARAKRG